MTAPNTIELVNVSGKFQEDDIVGFYTDTFHPVARVVSVYNYPNGSQSRLYVGDIISAPNTVGSTTLQNGYFDSNGNYTSTTASGTINNSSTPGSVISLSASGSIGGVGGSYSNAFASGAATNIYASPIVQGYSDFLNNYGVWGDGNNSTSYNGLFAVKFPAAGNYTVTVGSSGSATITANGTTIVTSPTNTPSSTSVATYTSSGAYTTNIGWVATSSGTTQSAIGVSIADANTGTVIFSSTNPQSLGYANLDRNGNQQALTEIVMPGGGSYFQNAFQVRLDPSSASSVSNYYVGSQITIQSKYVYSLNVAASPPVVTPAPSGGGGYDIPWDGGGDGGGAGGGD
jgi:hypothetical protein